MGQSLSAEASAFLEALEQGQTAVLANGLSKESSLATMDFDQAGNKAWHIITQQGHLAVLQVMVEAMSTILQRKHNFKLSPLELHRELSHLLNLRNVAGQTPLMLACESSHLSVVKYLLEHGANPWFRDCLGHRTALHYVARRDEGGAITATAGGSGGGGGEGSGGGVVSTADDADRAAVLQAILEFVSQNHVEVRALHGPCTKERLLDMVSLLGFTALHYAVYYCQYLVMGVLIHYGAHIGAQSTNNLNTPMHLAALRGNFTAVKIILRAYVSRLSGASARADGEPVMTDPRLARNREGNTPLMCARLNHHLSEALLVALHPATPLGEVFDDDAPDVRCLGPLKLVELAAAAVQPLLLRRFAEATATQATALGQEMSESLRSGGGVLPNHSSSRCGLRESDAASVSDGASLSDIGGGIPPSRWALTIAAAPAAAAAAPAARVTVCTAAAAAAPAATAAAAATQQSSPVSLSTVVSGPFSDISSNIGLAAQPNPRRHPSPIRPAIGNAVEASPHAASTTISNQTAQTHSPNAALTDHASLGGPHMTGQQQAPQQQQPPWASEAGPSIDPGMPSLALQDATSTSSIGPAASAPTVQRAPSAGTVSAFASSARQQQAPAVNKPSSGVCGFEIEEVDEDARDEDASEAPDAATDAGDSGSVAGGSRGGAGGGRSESASSRLSWWLASSQATHLAPASPPPPPPTTNYSPVPIRHGGLFAGGASGAHQPQANHRQLQQQQQQQRLAANASLPVSVGGGNGAFLGSAFDGQCDRAAFGMTASAAASRLPAGPDCATARRQQQPVSQIVSSNPHHTTASVTDKATQKASEVAGKAVAAAGGLFSQARLAFLNRGKAAASTAAPAPPPPQPTGTSWASSLPTSRLAAAPARAQSTPPTAVTAASGRGSLVPTGRPAAAAPAAAAAGAAVSDESEWPGLAEALAASMQVSSSDLPGSRALYADVFEDDSVRSSFPGVFEDAAAGDPAAEPATARSLGSFHAAALQAASGSHGGGGGEAGGAAFASMRFPPPTDADDGAPSGRSPAAALSCTSEPAHKTAEWLLSLPDLASISCEPLASGDSLSGMQRVAVVSRQSSIGVGGSSGGAPYGWGGRPPVSPSLAGAGSGGGYLQQARSSSFANSATVASPVVAFNLRSLGSVRKAFGHGRGSSAAAQHLMRTLKQLSDSELESALEACRQHRLNKGIDRAYQSGGAAAHQDSAGRCVMSLVRRGAAADAADKAAAATTPKSRHSARQDAVQRLAALLQELCSSHQLGRPVAPRVSFGIFNGGGATAAPLSAGGGRCSSNGTGGATATVGWSAAPLRLSRYGIERNDGGGRGDAGSEALQSPSQRTSCSGSVTASSSRAAATAATLPLSAAQWTNDDLLGCSDVLLPPPLPLQQPQLCSVCLVRSSGSSNSATAALLLLLQPCGHSLCADCASELVAHATHRPALCPLCRVVIGGFEALPPHQFGLSQPPLLSAEASGCDSLMGATSADLLDALAQPSGGFHTLHEATSGLSANAGDSLARPSSQQDILIADVIAGGLLSSVPALPELEQKSAAVTGSGTGGGGISVSTARAVDRLVGMADVVGPVVMATGNDLECTRDESVAGGEATVRLPTDSSLSASSSLDSDTRPPRHDVVVALDGAVASEKAKGPAADEPAGFVACR